MKTKLKRIISVFLCIAVIFSCVSVGSFAVSAQQNVTAVQEESGTSGFMKFLYNSLNVVVEGLVKSICGIYVDPRDWQSIDEYDSAEIGFMPGRETYQTSASDNNVWKLGYSKKSIVPDDIDSGKYNLGRDLLNKYAQGVYDDQCIRVAVIDDNSGEGAVVLGAIDSLGVTSTDTRSIRKAVLEYCETHGIKVASVNISATHAHSALDTQGVSTEFFKKLFGAFWCNLSGFSGHGLSMAFYGVAEDASGAGWMSIVEESPEDMRMQVCRLGPEKLFAVCPRWMSEGLEIVYPRRLRYVFLPKGGHVAMCKRYRKYAKAKGYLKELEKDGIAAAAEIGYPVLVRPSFVLGGRAMQIVANEKQLRHYLRTAVEIDEDKPVLVDKYIEGKGAIEQLKELGLEEGDMIRIEDYDMEYWEE